jgi:protein SCO1/2
LIPDDATGPRGASRARVWALSLLALAGAALTAAAFVHAWTRREPPAVMGQLPPFSFTDAAGRTVTSSDLFGRPWVADFIFTRCAGACPAMTARMSALRREAGADVTFVSFTVDPAHDTPDVLALYAQRAGAGPDWLFLTGPREALHRLAIDGFKLGVEELPPDRRSEGDGPFLHSSHFVLVDGRSRVRGYYDSTDEDALRRLRRDLAAVRAERS